MNNVPDLGLLARCLALEPSVGDTARLRSQLWSDVGAWEQLFKAASSLRLMPALALRLRQRGLVPPELRSGHSNDTSPAALLRDCWTRHTDIRASQAANLARIVAALNRNAIEPILLKGAASLWLETDPWRTMRDLDVLVPGLGASEAHGIVQAEGYLSDPDAAGRPERHHLDSLFRPDMPGWIEIHRLAGNGYAEQFLPTDAISASSITITRPAGRARILPAPHHIWHGLVHHYFGHRAFTRGVIDLKGLFEFAIALNLLSDDDRRAIVRLASQDSAGLAALDLWLAAAVDLLSMPLPSGFSLAEDACAVWHNMRRRNVGQTFQAKLPAYLAFVGLGWSGDRIARLTPAPAFSGLNARLDVLGKIRPRRWST